jgi:hypothetical protein
MDQPLSTLLVCLPKEFVLLKPYYNNILKTEATLHISDNTVSSNML